jgi:hypothetical protein
MNPIEKVFLPIANFTKTNLLIFYYSYLLENATDFQLIDTVAKLISNKVLQLIHNNAARCMLLLFFVNNFTNHLYQIGNEICDENQIPFSILHL